MDAAKVRAEEQRRQKAAALRYKRPALATMGYHEILSELYDMACRCDDIRWAEENCTEPVLDGDEDEGAGYRMEFSDLESEMDTLQEQLDLLDEEVFDDCTVSLIGNRFQCVGYDGYEEDFFSLCSYDAQLAQTESGKRIMRMTKAEMLATIGQCVGALIAFYDLRQRFDYIQTALGVTLGQNMDDLHTIHAIEDAYSAWCDAGCRDYGKELHHMERLLYELPDVYWIA